MLSKWFTNRAEHIADSPNHIVTVQNIRVLAPMLQCIRFVGDLAPMPYQPGQVAAFRVGKCVFHNCTPIALDQDEGWLDVLFNLANNCPNGRWADQLCLGDTAQLLGFEGPLLLQPRFRYHFAFADASALGLALALQNAAEAAQDEFLCLLELDQQQQGWPQLIQLDGDVVPPCAAAAARPAIQALQAWEAPLWHNWQGAHFYLAGQKTTIKALQKTLRQRGMRNEQITLFPIHPTTKKTYHHVSYY